LDKGVARLGSLSILAIRPRGSHTRNEGNRRRATREDGEYNDLDVKGTPAKLLGHVEAPDEAAAIKQAIEEFRVAPELQGRLLARRRA
jgi:hypothetical protein